MTEKLEDRIGRRLRKSIMTDDECRASYEIDRVLDACNTENESMLVRKLLCLVDLYEVDAEDADVVYLSAFAMEMTDRELGAWLLDVFSQCKTETERSMVNDMLIAINGWSIESLQNLPESVFENDSLF